MKRFDPRRREGSRGWLECMRVVQLQKELGTGILRPLYLSLFGLAASPKLYDCQSRPSHDRQVRSKATSARAVARKGMRVSNVHVVSPGRALSITGRECQASPLPVTR